MNHPTWEDFEARIKRLEQESLEQKEEIRRLKEQRTDEMKAINVNLASADVVTRLDTLEQKIDTVQEDANRVTIQMEGARADILKMGESQADLRDRLIEHGKDLKVIKEEQQIHKELLGQIFNVGEDHTKRFDQLEEGITSIKSTQEEILKLLRER